MTTVPRDRIAFIHLLRGLAPIFVLWAHIPGWWLIEKHQKWWLFDATRDLVILPFHLYQNAGHFGVVLFFLISGFIISHVATRETRLEFTVKRIFRIGPTLVCATALMVMSKGLANMFALGDVYGNSASVSWDYIYTIFLLDWFTPGGHTLSVTWSLATEVVFYVMMTVLLPRLVTHPIKATIWMLIVVAAVNLPHHISSHVAFWNYTLIYLPIIIAGRVLYLYWSGTVGRSCMLWLLGACYSVFLLLYTSRWPGQLTHEPDEPVVTYALALVVFYGAMKLNLARIPRLFTFLANISYPLYMIHLPVGMLILSAGSAAGLPIGMSVLLAILAAIAAARLVATFIDRPAQVLARRILASGRSSSDIT